LLQKLLLTPKPPRLLLKKARQSTKLLQSNLIGSAFE
jgi:hypothetical protein